MTQICLSKVYALIDEERGRLLDSKKNLRHGASIQRTYINKTLTILNRLKEKFARVSDADQMPLGL